MSNHMHSDDPHAGENCCGHVCHQCKKCMVENKRMPDCECEGAQELWHELNAKAAASTKPITIELSETDGYIVRQGDQYANKMCWDEMIGLLISLSMPLDNRPCLQWMRTHEQHESQTRFIKELHQKHNEEKE